MKVRTRFAPSPTGFLHVGGIRTAVFAWLLARQNKGQFILRLEDTDQKREVAGSAEHVMQSLKALGLDYDEGPDKDGPAGPYRQSQRLSIYKEWAQKLIDSGRAYADPYSAEEVQAFRDQAQQAKKPFLYRHNRPENPPAWDGTKPLRFKSDPKSYSWNDVVMGSLSTGPEVIDDFVLIKSDGFPTYNFAHIVDDAAMGITHVIRGQEFLASVPNYLNLYEALGLDRPLLATVPHILNEDGKKKLSKRDGARDVLDYIKQGYLPEALVNFIVSLGWNDGSEQEIYSIAELIDKFSLEKVGRGGAHFDEHRLAWVNGHHLRKKPLGELYQLSQPFWPPEAKNATEQYKKNVLGIVQERLKFLSELPDLTNFFFVDMPSKPQLISGNKQLGKVDAAVLKNLLVASKETLGSSDFSLPDLTERLNRLLETSGQKPTILFSLIRIAVTQVPASPGLADTLAVLGKERVVRRIDMTLENLGTKDR